MSRHVVGVTVTSTKTNGPFTKSKVRAPCFLWDFYVAKVAKQGMDFHFPKFDNCIYLIKCVKDSIVQTALTLSVHNMSSVDLFCLGFQL
jgi:hypothetical protein